MRIPDSCSLCGAPGRQVVQVSGQGGEYRRVLLGNQVLLLACGGCGALWCAAGQAHDPARLEAVPWDHAVRDWQKAYDLDDGLSLRLWHQRQKRALRRTGAGAG